MRTGYYQTIKHQGQERRALARYLKYELSYGDKEIKDTLSSIKSKRKEMFDNDIWDEIMDRLLVSYDNSEYIRGFQVGISQGELDVILSQPTLELRNLLFTLTVYFKWARSTKERLCMRGDDTWVKEADLDCCKLAGIDKMRKQERTKLFNALYVSGVYQTDFIRRYNDIFKLSFIDDRTPVIVIEDFNEIVAHLENYLDPKSCTKCSVCGSLIYKTNNRKHMCKWCSNYRKHKKG